MSVRMCSKDRAQAEARMRGKPRRGYPRDNHIGHRRRIEQGRPRIGNSRNEETKRKRRKREHTRDKNIIRDINVNVDYFR